MGLMRIIRAKYDRFFKVEIFTRISLKIIYVERTIPFAAQPRGMEEHKEFLLQAEYLAKQEWVVESLDNVQVKHEKYEIIVR